MGLLAEKGAKTEILIARKHEMLAKALQYEIDQLKGVSARLGSLANKHPISESALLSVSEHILRNAVVLEVLLARRIRPG
jgi:hypothetical protein